jgi:hypothetical protein
MSKKRNKNLLDNSDVYQEISKFRKDKTVTLDSITLVRKKINQAISNWLTKRSLVTKEDFDDEGNKDFYNNVILGDMHNTEEDLGLKYNFNYDGENVHKYSCKKDMIDNEKVFEDFDDEVSRKKRLMYVFCAAVFIEVLIMATQFSNILGISMVILFALFFLLAVLIILLTYKAGGVYYIEGKRFLSIIGISLLSAVYVALALIRIALDHKFQDNIVTIIISCISIVCIFLVYNDAKILANKDFIQYKDARELFDTFYRDYASMADQWKKDNPGVSLKSTLPDVNEIK